MCGARDEALMERVWSEQEDTNADQNHVALLPLSLLSHALVDTGRPGWMSSFVLISVCVV